MNMLFNKVEQSSTFTFRVHSFQLPVCRLILSYFLYNANKLQKNNCNKYVSSENQEILPVSFVQLPTVV